MCDTRRIKSIIKGMPTMEGAGVRLVRIFGYKEMPSFDPFLLLDHFGSDNPDDYLVGFPWHPHRGIETITYMLEGTVEHGDSLGNHGTIEPGDVQWMTAGSGIVHQEMPKGDTRGRMSGFQLWANLPASHKMTAPRYREINAAAIPHITFDHGVTVKVIAGIVDGTIGPVEDIVIEPEYLDITMPPNTCYNRPIKSGHQAFAYVFEGTVIFHSDQSTATEETVERGALALFSDHGTVEAKAGEKGSRLILVSGKPIGEPIAWRGPIVMNTEEELSIAFAEYRNGTFIR